MASRINHSMSLRDWGMLITLSLLWGGSFFLVEVAIVELPPLTIVTARVGIAAVVLWGAVLVARATIPRNWQTWVAFLGMGLINNVIPFTLIVWGQTHIGSGLAAILNATTPLFTVLLAGLFLQDERPTGLKIVGAVIGFLGVALMIGPGVLAGIGDAVLAQLAVLAAAASYAFAGVFGRRFHRMGISPLVTAAGQVSASALMLLPVTLWVERPYELAMPGAQTVLAIAALAVLSTACAYILYFRLLASAGATNLLLVTFLIPVSAILLATLVLNESLRSAHLLGMTGIAMGLLAIDGRLLRRWPAWRRIG